MTLQGVFGYYHCGLECFRKQIIKWALKVKDDSGHLGRRMSTSGLRSGSSAADVPSLAAVESLCRGEAEVRL